MGFLRFLLAIVVVISHSEPLFGFSLVGGKLAVQAFYIISGFYMALILNEKYIGVNKSYKLFITNRLIRLYPIYWAVLLIIIFTSICYGILSSGTNYGFLNTYIDNYKTLDLSTFIIIIFSNIFIFFQDALLFFDIDTATGLLNFQPEFNHNNLNGFKFALISPSWTIGLELLFYLIAPFLVKRKNYILLGLIIISILIKYLIKHQLGLNHTPWNFRFFPSELAFFLFGILVYRLYKVKKYLSLNKLFYLTFSALLVIMLLYDRLNFEIKYYVFFMLLFFCLPSLFEKTKNFKLDRLIGDLSYPIYICHMFVIVAINTSGYYYYRKGVTVIFISIIMAIVLKLVVSDKVETYRQNRLKH